MILQFSFNSLPPKLIDKIGHIKTIRALNKHCKDAVVDRYVQKYVTRLPSSTEMLQYLKKNYNDMRSSMAVVLFEYYSYFPINRPIHHKSMKISAYSNAEKSFFTHHVCVDHPSAFGGSYHFKLSDKNPLVPEAHFQWLFSNVKIIDDRDDHLNRYEILYLDPLSMIKIIQHREIYQSYSHRGELAIMKSIKNKLARMIESIASSNSTHFYACDDDEDEWRDCRGNLLWFPYECVDRRLNYYTLYLFALECGLNYIPDANILRCKIDLHIDIDTGDIEALESCDAASSVLGAEITRLCRAICDHLDHDQK
ncbi:Hypothetical protein POVR1_LOCUS610 [uncultured virus]|nr:Hypothetical protein POVR1_LOCUS610 [uncultured virus]